MQKEFCKNLNIDGSDSRLSFNLWRGYQAYWQIIDKQLYLVGIKGYANSNEILKRTFPNHYYNGKVLAYWFSSYLALAKDKMLKWDGVFSRTYFKEEIFNFKNGNLVGKRIVNNYIPVKNGISRLDSNRKHITDTLFKLVKKFNWKKLSDCGCDDKYLISINEKGKVSNVELMPNTNNKDTAQIEIDDHKKCIEKFKRKFKKLQFDIIRWHGQPYVEKYYLELFYNVEGKLENWTR
ncbi:hypothetical protein [Mucilaginibacter sp.]|uniref:hypothetical protein n=1 Tax=Mucilaginibacter sp. TaxID=1882438 RepID=UPI003D0ADA95